MKNLLIIVVLVVAVIGGYLLLKGRSNYSPPASTSTTQTTTPTEQSTSTETSKIAAKDFTFSPASITIKAGTTVTWTNEDSAPHQIADKPNGDMFKSGQLSQGQSYSFTFDKTGEYDYLCLIHPNMTGKVIVTP